LPSQMESALDYWESMVGEIYINPVSAESIWPVLFACA